MKTFALIALVASVSAIKIANEYVDKDGKVHPFYFPNDEETYEVRYQAINRNQEKKKEALAKYGKHPTNPVGYAWDTHLPNEQTGAIPAAAEKTEAAAEPAAAPAKKAAAPAKKEAAAKPAAKE